MTARGVSDSTSVSVVVRPLDDDRRKFIVDRPVVDGPARRFAAGDVVDHPVAEAVLAVPGVVEVALAENWVSVRKESGHDWSALEEPIRYALTTALTSLAGPSPGPRQPDMDDDTAYDFVEALFQRDINPAVARHGGRVELVDVQDGVVVVRMQGGCQGCGMATVTLRQGIEAQLRRAIPQLRGLRDITDHASGTNPYFQRSTT